MANTIVMISARRSLILWRMHYKNSDPDSLLGYAVSRTDSYGEHP